MALFSSGGSRFFFSPYVNMPKTRSLSSILVSLLNRETSVAQTSFEVFHRKGVDIAFGSHDMCGISCGADRGAGALYRLRALASGTDLKEMQAHPARSV